MTKEEQPITEVYQKRDRSAKLNICTSNSQNSVIPKPLLKILTTTSQQRK